MAQDDAQGVSLEVLDQDLEAGFAHLKATLIAGFRSLPTRESSEEMVRLLRHANRGLAEGQRTLHEDTRALIARLDALIKGRGDGAART